MKLPRSFETLPLLGKLDTEECGLVGIFRVESRILNLHFTNILTLRYYNSNPVSKLTRGVKLRFYLNLSSKLRG